MDGGQGPEEAESSGWCVGQGNDRHPGQRTAARGQLGAGIPAQIALAGLETGQLNEWRATLLVRETACLSAIDRSAVDEELASDVGTFSGAGDRAVIATARSAAYRRDRRSVADRASHAAAELHVAVHAALTRHADTFRSNGDPRSRGTAPGTVAERRTRATAPGSVKLATTLRKSLAGAPTPSRGPGTHCN